MGTFGTGPFQNDSGLDLKDSMAEDGPDGADARLRAALGRLATYEATTDTRIDPHEVYQTGVAACAIVADKLAGQYHYLPEPDDSTDFSLTMLPQMEGDWITRGTAAIDSALRLEASTLLPQWNSKMAAKEHRAVLRELEERIKSGTHVEAPNYLRAWIGAASSMGAPGVQQAIRHAAAECAQEASGAADLERWALLFGAEKLYTTANILIAQTLTGAKHSEAQEILALLRVGDGLSARGRLALPVAELCQHLTGPIRRER